MMWPRNVVYYFQVNGDTFATSLEVKVNNDTENELFEIAANAIFSDLELRFPTQTVTGGRRFKDYIVEDTSWSPESTIASTR